MKATIYEWVKYTYVRVCETEEGSKDALGRT